MKIIEGKQKTYGPCPQEWNNCKCECGWIYNENDIETYLDDDCDVCKYCGSECCPECGDHLHCGDCI